MFHFVSFENQIMNHSWEKNQMDKDTELFSHVCALYNLKTQNHFIIKHPVQAVLFLIGVFKFLMILETC